MSETLSMASRQVPVPPVEYVTNIRGGEHGVMFYTSIEDMRKILFAFVRSGLENNWGVIYSLPGSAVNEIRSLMQDYGIDIQKYEAEGSLYIISGEDSFKDPFKPDLEYCKSLTEQAIKNFNNQGKRGTRIATELSSFFLPLGLYVALYDLESLFERRTVQPVTLICAYDATIIPATTDLDIAFFYKRINKEWRKFVDAHSFAIYTAKGKDIIFTI